MADPFPSDSVLLVGKFQGSVGDALDGCVIQRCGQSGVDGAIDGQMDMSQLKGLGSGVFASGLSVFGGAEEPVEGDNDEVEEVSVKAATDGVIGVEDVESCADDGEVDRACSVWWGVVAPHGVEESFV